eukprot:TRINITY_DN11700_c0_g1_i2.p1 TRINITY_DN11700_c0_g1~~TRINITY_DN11700_c0_g1_i2.p1  ORF type:complete len:146 (+),score=52.04 TRINITY_DN11700_c0_g1_i2:78-515(+)
MIRRPPRSTQGVSSAASDVYKRQYQRRVHGDKSIEDQKRNSDIKEGEVPSFTPRLIQDSPYPASKKPDIEPEEEITEYAIKRGHRRNKDVVIDSEKETYTNNEEHKTFEEKDSTSKEEQKQSDERMEEKKELDIQKEENLSLIHI